ncbi:MAG: hypothetical protein JSW67_00490 [Candidatus Latescibacterota bacterium]|nr:MAG: hypothetical protein JSW67_00490 [Candidatus Latescibacterota bacterium]
MGAYFVELRGLGIQALLESEQFTEVLVVLGVVVVFALVAQIAVASAIGPNKRSGMDRRLLRRVLEMDPEDPELLDASDLPSDLREIVRAVSSEKQRARDATHELQVLRQEINELVKGMERSIETHDPLREEQTTETTARLARLWNGLMAESQEGGGASQTATPAATPLSAGGVGAAAAMGVVSRDLDDLTSRLGEIEGDLAKLWDVMGSGAAKPRPHSPDSALDLQRPELPPSFGTSAREAEPRIPSEFGPSSASETRLDPSLEFDTAAASADPPSASEAPRIEPGFATSAVDGLREFDLSDEVEEVTEHELGSRPAPFAEPFAAATEMTFGAAPDPEPDPDAPQVDGFAQTFARPPLFGEPQEEPSASPDFGSGVELTLGSAAPATEPEPAAPQVPTLDAAAFGAQEPQSAEASAAGFHEWSGAGPEHHLGNLLRDEIASDTSEAEAATTPVQESVGFGREAESAAPLQSRGYSQAHPNFGAGAGPADRVEVTYDPGSMESSTEMSDAQQIEAEYEKRAPGESMIVDLRSLGAVEFDD